MRLWIATLGWNYDLESYWIVANLVEQGRNVWAYTARINYGPIWPGIVWLLFRLQPAFGWTSMTGFHFLVVTILTGADIGITVWLARRMGLASAALFFLCPVTILITGFHSQIDTIAIVLALWSWQRAQAVPDGTPAVRMLGPGLLLGLSLATKHVFALFPLWVLMRPSMPLGRRLAYAAVAYGTWAAAFAPFVLTADGWHGVMNRSLLYRGDSWFGNGLLPHLIADDRLWTPAFVAALLGVGWIAARRAPREMFLLYPLTLVACTTTMADQYLAIPIVSAAAYGASWPMGAYVLAATLTLLGSPGDIGILPALQPLAEPLRAAGFVLGGQGQSTLLPQICLSVLLVGRLTADVRRRLSWDSRWAPAGLLLVVVLAGGMVVYHQRLVGSRMPTKEPAAGSELLGRAWQHLIDPLTNPMVAVDEARAVLAGNPTHYVGRALLAAALDRAGLYEEARLHWEWVLVQAEDRRDEPTVAEARKRMTPEWLSDTALLRDGLDALRAPGTARVAPVYFRAVLDRAPDRMTTAGRIARALDAAGQPQAARPYWEQVLALAETANDRPAAATARARLGAK